MVKTKKRKKSSRYSGRGMGTHGTGARKNKRDSGNQGGKGLAGTGKRGDQKKTLVIKKYGSGYFGKKGVTSIGTKRDKSLRVNVGDIDKNIASYLKKGLAKTVSNGKGYEVDLSKYKILGSGDVQNNLKINAESASKLAKEKVEKAGGEIIMKSEDTKEKDKTQENVPEDNKEKTEEKKEK